jgi:hypothetical protein
MSSFAEIRRAFLISSPKELQRTYTMYNNEILHFSVKKKASLVRLIAKRIMDDTRPESTSFNHQILAFPPSPLHSQQNKESISSPSSQTDGLQSHLDNLSLESTVQTSNLSGYDVAPSNNLTKSPSTTNDRSVSSASQSFSFFESMFATLIFSLKGRELTQLKMMLDSDPSHPSFFAKIFPKLSPALRCHLLQYIEEEAMIYLKSVQTSIPSIDFQLWGSLGVSEIEEVKEFYMLEMQTRTKTPSAYPVPCKVYCDFDDTTVPRLYDHSFPSSIGTYPGIQSLLAALKGELDHSKLDPDVPSTSSSIPAKVPANEPSETDSSGKNETHASKAANARLVHSHLDASTNLALALLNAEDKILESIRSAESKKKSTLKVISSSELGSIRRHQVDTGDATTSDAAAVSTDPNTNSTTTATTDKSEDGQTSAAASATALSASEGSDDGDKSISSDDEDDDHVEAALIDAVIMEAVTEAIALERSRHSEELAAELAASDASAGASIEDEYVPSEVHLDDMTSTTRAIHSPAASTSMVQSSATAAVVSASVSASASATPTSASETHEPHHHRKSGSILSSVKHFAGSIFRKSVPAEGETRLEHDPARSSLGTRISGTIRRVFVRRSEGGHAHARRASLDLDFDAASFEDETDQSQHQHSMSSTASDQHIVPGHGHLTYLSARPEFLRRSTVEALHTLNIHPQAILCGTISGMVSSHARIAARKYDNYAKHSAVFPEFATVFFGDSGQGDVIFGLQVLDAWRKENRTRLQKLISAKKDGTKSIRFSTDSLPLLPPPLILIHDIVKATGGHNTPHLQRATYRAKGVHFFDSYIEAALICCQYGLITHTALEKIISTTTDDLKHASKHTSKSQQAARTKELQEATSRAMMFIQGRGNLMPSQVSAPTAL